MGGQFYRTVREDISIDHREVEGRALDPHRWRGYSSEIIVPASPPEEG